MSVEFQTPVVVCDVGGTNTRVAVVREAGRPAERVDRISTASFATFEAALAHAFTRRQIRPRSMIVCGAGPVEGRHLELTNAAWRLDGEALAAQFGLSQGLLLNDFEAQALSLPVIGAQHTRTIGPAIQADSGPRLILGPGTGLGVAALIAVDGKYAALPSEAGHVDFAAVEPDEGPVWAHLERFHGRITAETLISGAGLERLHAARMSLRGGGDRLHAAAITAAALGDSGGPEAETVRMFWRLVARFAGDMAIVFSATGGVTLAGGILPRIASLLDDDEFRKRFCAKAPVQHLPKRIPTRLLTAADSVLDGMAAIASSPEAYAIDYANRAWR